jgi:hypothetical protein
MHSSAAPVHFAPPSNRRERHARLAIMVRDPSSSGNDSRVVHFRRRATATRPAAAGPSPVEDLAKFERGGEKEDYRHRMLVNAAAVLFVAALIGTGYWLANSMATLRRNQDCVLAGHRNCASIEVKRDR